VAFAVCFTKKEKAELMELSDPLEAAPGHVLGRTLYTLISPGTELNHGFLHDHADPYYPGYAAVFEALQIGSGIEHIKPGDKLFCMGRHQSFQHISVKETILIPADMSPSEAVLIRLMNIGLTTLSTTTAKPCERMIISGAGPVGLLAALLFQRCGYDVGVCDQSEERRAIASSAGIKHVWGAFPLDNPNWAGRTALVLDCSGHEGAVLDGCRIVRHRGEVVLGGVPWKKNTDATAQDVLSLVFHGYVVLRSGWEWGIPNHSDSFSPHGIFDNLQKGLNWLLENHLELAPITRIYSPLQAQEAYTGLAARNIQELFVLFDWSILLDGGNHL
jgi:threonine dehydrogenase-like Zn-dependent dehydrogenase